MLLHLSFLPAATILALFTLVVGAAQAQPLNNVYPIAAENNKLVDAPARQKALSVSKMENINKSPAATVGLLDGPNSTALGKSGGEDPGSGGGGTGSGSGGGPSKAQFPHQLGEQAARKDPGSGGGTTGTGSGGNGNKK